MRYKSGREIERKTSTNGIDIVKKEGEGEEKRHVNCLTTHRNFPNNKTNIKDDAGKKVRKEESRREWRTSK